ncbi:MAG: sigma-70 family RNA polymerase sigma factor [Planctomycetota bacterium]|jgi:RNA polymerase sigma-70 factor (ECF subfamily)
MGEASGATDQALVARASSGDEGAFEELVLKYQDRVYGLALRLTRRPEEAEDVTQEAFLKAYRALGDFKGESAFYTWLFRITFNSAHSRLRTLGRRHSREKVVSFGAADPEAGEGAAAYAAEPASPEPEPVAVLESADAAERVKQAIDGLTPDNRAAITLREVEGLSYEEIAEVTGWTRAAVKSRLHRVRQELAGALRDLVQ